jgi:hypothetical protein
MNKYENAKEAIYSALWEICDCQEETYTAACMGEYPEQIAEEIHRLAVKLSNLAQQTK